MGTPQKVAVIGLGSMGYGIAASILRAGHRTWGFDVVPAQAERFRAEGGAAGTLAAVAGELDAAAVVVLNARADRGGALRRGRDRRRGCGRARWSSPARRCRRPSRGRWRRVAARPACSISTRRSRAARLKAAEGRLTVMASGAPEAFAAARPVLEATAETVFELGDEPGAGSAMKAVNQLLAGVHIAAMAEALTFGMTQGIAPARFLEVISRCAGTSWMLENRAPHVVAGDYAPRSAVDIWPKDLGIVLETAREARFAAPLAAAALQQFLAASGSGLGREDDAAVAKVYARNAGLELPGA